MGIHSPEHPLAINGTSLDPYIWRGASMTGGGIHSSENFWMWVLADKERIATLQAAVRERHSLREYAIDGDYWILSPTIGGVPTQLSHPGQWAVWQLHRPEGDGVVTLLRR